MTAPRKRRKKRLGPVGGSWSTEFSLDSNEWKAIEVVYRHSLPLEVRESITTAVKEYFFLAPFEQHAPFQDDVDKWLVQIGRAALQLGNAMCASKKIKTKQSPSPQNEMQHAGTEPIDKNRAIDRASETAMRAMLSESIVFTDWPQLRQLNRNDISWEMLVEIPYAIFSGTKRAQRHLQDAAKKGVVEGSAWAALIRVLTELCERYGLPTTVAKDKGKSRNLNSEFLRMFEKLQLNFPGYLQRHTHGEDALAWGISEARKGTRSRKIKSVRERISPLTE